MYGTIQFTFGFSSITFHANANEFDTAKCNQAFKQLKNAADVNCVQETLDPQGGTGSYIITFNKWSTYPYENNFFNHSGNPHIQSFSCNTTNVDEEEAKDVYCTIEDLVTTDLPGKLKKK